MLVLAQENGDTVKDAFSWSAALQYTVLVVTLLAGLLVLGRALNKRIKNAAQSATWAAMNEAEKTRGHLSTSNGSTIGEYVENSAHTLERLERIACDNRDLAQQAVKLGIQNREDIQRHRMSEHGDL